MNFQASVYGWVYSLRDYYQMFDLSDRDLDLRILDFPGSISSFNAEMHQQGKTIVSGDECYELSQHDMAEVAKQVFSANQDLLREQSERLRGHDESVLESIFNDWFLSKQLFLEDYTKGQEEGRYCYMQMPQLPFDDDQFELALCSDFLALTQQAYQSSPQDLVNELCRVAEEVRLYPLMNAKGEMNDAIGPVMLSLQQHNFGVEVREVPYEQQGWG